MQPLPLGESGRVWVGTGSWLAALLTGLPPKPLGDMSSEDPAKDEGGCAGCGPARPKKTYQGREGAALHNPFCAETEPAPDRRSHFYLARGAIAKFW